MCVTTAVGKKELLEMGNYFKKVGDKFKKSGSELSKPQNLAVASMLLAIAVVLRYFENNGMALLGTNLIKVGFDTLPVAVAAMLYGPVVGGIVGGLTDFLGFIAAPVGGAYIPGFTISMIIMGMIYGIAFYKETIKLPRIIITEVIITLFVNIFLGVTWVVLFYGMSLEKALSIRGIKEFFDLPITVALNFAVFKLLVKIPEIRRTMRIRKKA